MKASHFLWILHSLSFDVCVSPLSAPWGWHHWAPFKVGWRSYCWEAKCPRMKSSFQHLISAKRFGEVARFAQHTYHSPLLSHPLSSYTRVTPCVCDSQEAGCSVTLPSVVRIWDPQAGRLWALRLLSIFKPLLSSFRIERATCSSVCSRTYWRLYRFWRKLCLQKTKLCPLFLFKITTC